MDCSLPGSSVHGIFQARILEWVAISSSRGSSWPRDWTWVSRTAGKFFTIWATMEAHVIQLKRNQLGSDSNSSGPSDPHMPSFRWAQDQKKEPWLCEYLPGARNHLIHDPGLPYSCLENPMDRGAWWAAVHGVAKSWTRLSDFTFTFMHWKRKWQPTPVFLPGESQGWRSLVGCRLWGRTESDTMQLSSSSSSIKSSRKCKECCLEQKF